MSVVVLSDHASSPDPRARSWATSRPVQRVAIAAIGCAVMALSGSGLASYLDTSGAAGAGPSSIDTGQADAAPLN